MSKLKTFNIWKRDAENKIAKRKDLEKEWEKTRVEPLSFKFEGKTYVEFTFENDNYRGILNSLGPKGCLALGNWLIDTFGDYQEETKDAK